MASSSEKSKSTIVPSTALLSNFEVEQIVTNHLAELGEIVRASRFSEVGLLGPVEVAERAQVYLRDSPTVSKETINSLRDVRNMLRAESGFTPLEELHVINYLPSSEAVLHMLLNPTSSYNTEETRPVLLEKIASLRLFDPSNGVASEDQPPAETEGDLKDDGDDL